LIYHAKGHSVGLFLWILGHSHFHFQEHQYAAFIVIFAACGGALRLSAEVEFSRHQKV
jgi:hypothetical protein